MAKSVKTAQKAGAAALNLYRYMAWSVLAGAWLLLVASLVSYDPADASSPYVFPKNTVPSNWGGGFGDIVAFKAYHVLGPGVWILVAGCLVALIRTAKQQRIEQIMLRLIGLIVMAVATSALLRMTVLSRIDWPPGTGQLLAFYVNNELLQRFNTLGTLIILTVAWWIGALLAMDEVVLVVPRFFLGMFTAAYHAARPQPALAGRLSSLWRRGDSARNGKAAGGVAELDDDGLDEEAGELTPTDDFKDKSLSKTPSRAALAAAKKAAASDAAVAELDDDEEADEQPTGRATVSDLDDDDEGGADAPGAYLAEKAASLDPDKFDPDALRAKIKKLPINFTAGASPLAKNAPPAKEVDLSGYRFPGIDLLEEPEGNFTAAMETIVREQAEVLEMALKQYRIDGEVVGIEPGPVITMYEVRLAAGTKVAVLSAVSSDLARALKAPNVRIVPNIVGKDTVGIEVPNIKKEKVRLKELMTSHPEVGKMSLPMLLGKDASGNPLVEDLAKMPHMLIAGTTGSGKSVCMNSIIMSFLFFRRPDELKLVLVDPKMVEMSQFKDIPHLMCPVVTEMGKAAAILEWAVTKMDERYELLAEAGVRDIASYNALGWEELKVRFQPASESEEARIPRKLPFMVFVIDELADLMMTNKEVEGFIVRIAQKARAVGMHLILATQRPQANVVTGLIKSNMPCRVSFKVASGMDSRIVLDQKGAELLLGQGDMLFISPRSSKLTRAQGTLVDDLEIRKTVKFLKEVAEPSFEPQLVQLRSATANVDEEAEKDPLFEDAVRCVLDTKRGSVSLLQRRLTIGYSRASRLIEAMYAAGILGEYKGSQAREVNLTVEEWDAMRAQMHKDAEKTESKSDDRSTAGSKDWANEGDDDDDDSVPDELDGEFRR